MTYASVWPTLSARIRGLVRAGEFHARLLSLNSSDSYGRWRSLRKQSAEILLALDVFKTTFASSLPTAVAAAIDGFVKERSELIAGNIDANMGPEATTAGLTFLAALESELSFLLASNQEVIRAKSERSFVHLQRAIVADPDIQAKWRAAFAEGESRCEKLGAVHLLSHGIFAFKVSGEGERTDLVFNDPLDSSDSIQRFADGLVLTEWKVAKAKNVATQLDQARLQAKRYGQGVLSGIELAARRYLVMVSEEYLPEAAGESVDGAITYRHINIAVNPASPSRARSAQKHGASA